MFCLFLAGLAPGAVFMDPPYIWPHSSTWPQLQAWGISPDEWQFMVMNPQHWQVRVDNTRETPTSKKEEEKTQGKQRKVVEVRIHRGQAEVKLSYRPAWHRADFAAGLPLPERSGFEVRFFLSPKTGCMVYRQQKLKEVWMLRPGLCNRVRTAGRRGEPYRRAPG